MRGILLKLRNFVSVLRDRDRLLSQELIEKLV